MANRPCKTCGSVTWFWNDEGRCNQCTGRPHKRTLKMRVALFFAKWMLKYLERKIAKCKRNIASDLDALKKMDAHGITFPDWAMPDPQHWAGRIKDHRKLLRATKLFVMREGLDK